MAEESLHGRGDSTTPKEDIKELIGRSPNISDTFIMRMCFVLREKMGVGSGFDSCFAEEQIMRFDRVFSRHTENSTQ